MTYTMTHNATFGSLEINFDGKPCEAVRDALKELRFRWHNVRRVWYGYADEATTRAAIDGANGDNLSPIDKQNRQPEEMPFRFPFDQRK